MRNFSSHSTVTTEAFRGPYQNVLAKARTAQKKAPVNVGYTIDGDESGEGVVTKHEVWGGGTPPYQEIIHSAN